MSIDSVTDNRVEAPAAPSAAQDRQALIAALGFPVLVIIGGVVGYLVPETAASFAPQVTPLLGIVMFGMGLTLKPVDFALVARRPLPVLIGVVAQFVIMPLVALLVVAVMDLPDAVAAGVILVGCAPGGTSSNVVSYLARGDVALSVTMTSISTLLAPVLTPLLTLWLAGEYMPVSTSTMAWSIVKVVLIPVVAGILIGMLVPRVVAKINAALPWISVAAISAIVCIVVGGAHDTIATAGALVFAAVVIHNGCGYGLGHRRNPDQAADRRAAHHGRRGGHAKLRLGHLPGIDLYEPIGRPARCRLFGVAQPLWCGACSHLPLFGFPEVGRKNC